jgi:hypothetical protein
MIEVRRFDNSKIDDWNVFLDKSKNTSFLFNRNFMDYHSDRFLDYSLMVYKNDKLIAILPANLSDTTLVSHQGLSYGGVVIHDDIKLVDVINSFKAILAFLHNHNISTVLLKLIPKMYHTRPSDELDWILFKVKAELFRRDTALVVDNQSSNLKYQERRVRSIKKALKHSIEIKEGLDQFSPFWIEILEPNLKDKHGVTPVHNLSEIKLLAERFPENIKQHNIYFNNKIVAGCTVFLTNSVAHAQYISGNQEGREMGGLDFLFDFLIKDIYSSNRFFDFGICNEKNGEVINNGLLDWKEGFGARSIVHDFYEINTSNFNLLNENIFI